MADIIWTKVQVVLTDVPIEYMNCNSESFADGDEVIVEFTEQDWDQPKIIGFKEAPKPCTSVFVFSNEIQWRYESESRTMRINYNSNSWSWESAFPRSYGFGRVEYAVTGENGLGFIICGAEINFAGGREGYFGHLDIFDSIGETFSIGADHPQSKAGLSFNSLKNGQCISHGGKDFTTVYDATHRYLISFDLWQIAQSDDSIYDHASFVIDDLVFIVAGSMTQEHGKKSNAVTKSYSNYWDVWSSHVTCPQENWLKVHGYSLEGKGLVGGGGMIYDPTNEIGLIDTISDTYLYDSISNSWTRKANGYASFGDQATSTALEETVALQFSGGGAGSLTHWFDYKLSTDVWRDRGVFKLTVNEDPIWYSHRKLAAGTEL
jgi:hypothetical protein